METCVMSAVYAATNGHARELLEACGAEILSVPAETCCGALHLHSGDVEGARALARQNVRAWADIPGNAWIVAHAGGCEGMYREYGHLVGPEAGPLAERVHDFGWALAHLSLRPTFEPDPRSVGLQNSCHLVNVVREGEWASRWIREASSGYTPLASQDSCCGSAGVYNLNQPELASRIAARHTAEWTAAGIGRLVVNNPGCALQCRAEAEPLGVEVVQLADFLYERWTGNVAPGGLAGGPA
jgi:glycolate oxidase iron-sulfur subunit